MVGRILARDGKAAVSRKSGGLWRRAMGVVIALLAGWLMTAELRAATTFTYLNYLGNGSLSGYSHTMKSSSDVDHYHCVFWGVEPVVQYECEVWVYGDVGVYAELSGPPGLHDSYSASDFTQAVVSFIAAGSNIEPGSWLLFGQHGMEVTYHWETCLAPQGCFGGSHPQNPYISPTMAQAVVPLPPCESMAAIDGVAISEMLNWQPQPEPFERGARLLCQNGQVVVGNRASSFGPNDTPPGPYAPTVTTPTTYDPCRAVVLATNALAGIHSHPYFENAAQYNAGIGCHGIQDPDITWSELSHINVNVNTQFSVVDQQWVGTHGVPLYMRTPLVGVMPFVGKILRLDPPGNGTPVEVWSQ